MDIQGLSLLEERVKQVIYLVKELKRKNQELEETAQRLSNENKVMKENEKKVRERLEGLLHELEHLVQ